MTDYAEKERQFLAELEADTGRDLAAWMAAISAENLPHRNDIIDWLRRQRFTFDEASWLERIHNNGGQPIYAGKPDLRPPATVSASEAQQRPARSSPPRAELPRAAAAPAPPALGGEGDIEPLLARGKAYRPLATHLIRTLSAAIPGLGLTARSGLVSLGTGGRSAEFGVIQITGKDVKLGLALGDAAPRGGLEPARIPGAGPAITHMIVLVDVRRIDAALLAHVAAAVETVRPA